MKKAIAWILSLLVSLSLFARLIISLRILPLRRGRGTSLGVGVP